MQAHEFAFGSRDLLAPADFRRALKRAFRDAELDCWFSPRDVRQEMSPSGPLKKEGCWVIWMKCRETHVARLGRGFQLSFPVDVWVPVFKLDGTFRNPTIPGAWAIQALLMSDLTRPCNRDRFEKLNAINVADAEKEFAEKRDVVDHLSRDKVWKNILRKQDERLGREAMSGDDKAAWRRHWDAVEKKEQAALQKAVEAAKLYEFHKRRK